MVFVLNVLAFILIGLQLGPIIEHLSRDERSTYAEVAVAVLAVVIVTRIVWVMSFYTLTRSRGVPSARTRRTASRASTRAATLSQPSVQGGVLVSWCGMRGIVTLAAALALPAGDHPFPGRPLILVTAFTVVLGTLVLQGLTLRPLLAWLELHDDGPVEHEVDEAREAALRAALGTIDGDGTKPARALRYELEELLSNSAEAELGSPGEPAMPVLRQRAVDAARAEIKRLRFDEIIGDDAYHRVELVLDRTELYAETGRSRSADG